MQVKIKKRQVFTTMGFALILLIALLSTPVWAENLVQQKDNPYLVRTFVDPGGRQIDEIIVPGRPPEIKAKEAKIPEPNIAMGINSLSNVPAFDWSYGCSATSGAMMAGYYDRTGYSNMYAGSTNGGVCPMDNFVWGQTWWVDEYWSECPLSATHNGIDGRTTLGHVDDYWIDYGNDDEDPFITGEREEHSYGDCTGDYMKTNQYKYGNSDGSTTFYFWTSGAPISDSDLKGLGVHNNDGGYGLKLFFESRGYVVTDMYNQYLLGYNPHGPGGPTKLGFTFEQFKQEIDAGRVVMIHVKGHSMVGFGYDDSSESLVYIHDTWDYLDHSMTWGKSYEGLKHYGVTVIQLQSVITSCNSDGTEINTFAPAESVYVKGSGLEPNTDYNIWIQDNPVGEGDPLVTEDDDSGAQETVTADENGDFVPTEIWDIPEGASVSQHEYDIVVNKGTGEVGQTYNAADDGIDSATAVGITAPVPELPTLILFSMGLLVLVGYALVKRK
jgi:hypothetical protein